MGYSGDAAAVAEENQTRQYILPKEDGSAVWTDNAIAHTAVEISMVHMPLISFMLRQKMRLEMLRYVGYSAQTKKQRVNGS